MELSTFNLQSLTEFDNARVATAFEHAVARCIRDCEDRPGVKGVRKVTLTVNVAPVPDEGGDLAECAVAFDVKDTAPSQEVARLLDARRARPAPLQRAESRRHPTEHA